MAVHLVQEEVFELSDTIGHLRGVAHQATSSPLHAFDRRDSGALDNSATGVGPLGISGLKTSMGFGWVLDHDIVFLPFDGPQKRSHPASFPCPQRSVRVGLLDEGGRPVPGFALDDCDPISADSTRQTVSWQGRNDVGSLAGTVVQLQFRLQDARLFALEFVPDE